MVDVRFWMFGSPDDVSNLKPANASAMRPFDKIVFAASGP
jgi:hypothetical protein